MATTPPDLQVVLDEIQGPAKALKDSLARAITTLTPVPQAPRADETPQIGVQDAVNFCIEIHTQVGQLIERISNLEKSQPTAETIRRIGAIVDAWRAAKEPTDAPSVRRVVQDIKGILAASG